MMKRKVTGLCALLLIALLCGACNRSASTLNVKVGGQETPLKVKSAGAVYGTVAITSFGRPVQAAAHDIYIANYEMDTTSAAAMMKPLTEAGQMRVMLQLTGAEKTNATTPFRLGTYKAKADSANSVRAASVTTFAGGKEVTTDLGLLYDRSQVDGDVKITKVASDAVTGKIDLTAGDKIIYGYFTAKLPKTRLF